MTERFPAELSVSILLTHGRSGRLFLTRHGVKLNLEASWGPMAGGIDQTDADPWEAALREAYEEANIKRENIIFVRGRNSMEPHAVMIRGNDKNIGGYVFDATYSGPKITMEGYLIENDEKVDRVELFTWRRVLGLLDGEEKIYLSDFNEAQLIRWSIREAGVNQNRKIVVGNWLRNRIGKIDGLYRDENGETGYVPPYNQWMTTPGIRGEPEKTNFARKRFFQK